MIAGNIVRFPIGKTVKAKVIIAPIIAIIIVNNFMFLIF
jgi:hypothetical protein